MKRKDLVGTTAVDGISIAVPAGASLAEPGAARLRLFNSF